MSEPISKNMPVEQRAMEALNAAVLLFDSDMRLRYINPAGEMLFAISARHLLGQPARNLILCPDTEIERYLRAALASGQPFS